MKPSMGAAFVAAIVAVAALGAGSRKFVPAPAQPGRAAASGAAECPPGTLPDDSVCIPVPRSPARSRSAAFFGTPSGDRIQRRPERPADYGRYRFPVASWTGPLGGPSDALSDGGTREGGVFIHAAPNLPVSAVHLDGQVGPTELLFVGELTGATVVTRHAVGDGARVVLLVVGDLGALPRLSPGSELPEGTELGRTGRAPVYLEARVCRAGVDPRTLAPAKIRDDAFSILEDVRNVLPLR